MVVASVVLVVNSNFYHQLTTLLPYLVLSKVWTADTKIFILPACENVCMCDNRYVLMANLDLF